MGKSSGGSTTLQDIATIQAINAANTPPPPAPTPLPIMPYQASPAAAEAARNKFAEGLKGQEADILGGAKKKNKLAAAGGEAAVGDSAAAPQTDSYSQTKLGA